MSLERVVFLLVFGFLWTPVRGDVSVTCVYMASCLLPCPFDPGPEVVIHWLYTLDESTPVHTFYHNQDQLARQKPRYKDRTTLFKDQISKGNASLQLNSVQIPDGGRYKCYTSTTNVNKEQFINVQVQAPVGDVVLEQRGDELICSSTNIYPKPEVTWSGPDVTEAKTEVSEKENKLYSIHSSVPLSDGQEHSCTVSTGYSWRRATLKQQDPITASDSKTTLHCVDSNSPIKSLVWKFNQTQTILNQTGTNIDYNESWRQFVEEVSESGLTLKNLDSGHQGVYSCVLSSDRETLISRTVLSVSDATKSDHTTVIIAVVVVLGVILGVVVLGVFVVKPIVKTRKKKEKRKEEKKRKNQQEKSKGSSEPVWSPFIPEANPNDNTVSDS